MMFVADTNVVSELMKRVPSESVIDWFYDHEGDVYLTSITVKELYFGMLRLPAGRRKEALRQAIMGVTMDCADKTLPFDAFSGYLCATLHDRALKQGRTPQIEDLMIAAICQRNEAVLATRNTKDFEYLDVSCVNPFDNR